MQAALTRCPCHPCNTLVRPARPGPPKAERAAIQAELDALATEQPEAIKGGFAEPLLRGVASHHAGCLPAWKGLVERLFQRGELAGAGAGLCSRAVRVAALLVARVPALLMGSGWGHAVGWVPDSQFRALSRHPGLLQGCSSWSLPPRRWPQASTCLPAPPWWQRCRGGEQAAGSCGLNSVVRLLPCPGLALGLPLPGLRDSTGGLAALLLLQSPHRKNSPGP